MVSPRMMLSARRHLALTTASLFIAALALISGPPAGAIDRLELPTPIGSGAGIPDEHAPVRTTSGVLRDAETASPIRDSCVGWRPTSALDTDDNSYTKVNESGAWSFDSSSAGPFLLSFYVARGGNCADPIDRSHRPSWFANQAFTSGDTDPVTARPPVGVTLTKVDAGTTGVVACLGVEELPGTCAIPDTALSGRVFGSGPEPIQQACVLAFGHAGFLSGAITDTDGRWSIPDLPVATPLVVGVLPPLDLGNGPCVFGDGMPASPAEGELQPEFYPNTWIDLADPRLVTQSYEYGAGRGARVLTDSVNGITVCLTTDAGDVVSRSACTATSPLLLFFGTR